MRLRRKNDVDKSSNKPKATSCFHLILALVVVGHLVGQVTSPTVMEHFVVLRDLMETYPNDVTTENSTATRVEVAANADDAAAVSFEPPICSVDQLRKIEEQLPPYWCVKSHTRPYKNRCSFSQATGCPETPWLDHHLSQPPQTKETEQPFLSFFVGCNKAIDAVHALRIGSRNPKFDVQQWRTGLARGGNFSDVSCDQFRKDYDNPSQQHENVQIRPAQVYCFEPVSSTFAELQRTKREMGWNNELILEEAAVSSEAGSLSVPKNLALGDEKTGLTDMKCGVGVGGNDCRQIPIYTLNDYVESIPGKPHIHYLSIDVEGFDYEVLRGASDILRQQVHYLEFEYNWKGPWAQQYLSDAINTFLHDQHGFVCYWPGPHDGHIWRITGCWLEHYDLRFWSNVACVNVKIPEARPLAIDMEQRFLRTLEIDGLLYSGLAPTGMAG